MTAQQVNIPMPDNETAVLILPQLLTLEALGGLEQSLTRRLGELRREMGSQAGDPGTLEYESWMQYLRPARS